MLKKMLTLALIISFGNASFAQEDQSCEGIKKLSCTGGALKAATAITGASTVYYTIQNRGLGTQQIFDIVDRETALKDLGDAIGRDGNPNIITPNRAETQILRQVKPTDTIEVTYIMKNTGQKFTDTFPGTQTRQASALIRDVYFDHSELVSVARFRTQAEHNAFRKVAQKRLKGSVLLFGFTIAASWLSFSEDIAERHIELSPEEIKFTEKP
ncbi:MAG: hypothetical protein V4654_07100 [Bdellovibrionota bacterium]